MATILRGMTWNHVRGYAPLAAVAEQFAKQHPDIVITWDKRPLKDFEDYPIERLAAQYDIIMLDHPCIGMAAAKQVLVPLDEWLPAFFLEDQRANSVGPSYGTYNWEGRQWALAVDAAAQVSACRKDVLDGLGLAAPRNWEEVFELARELPQPYRIAVPLHPTHAFLSLLALSCQLRGESFRFSDRSRGFDAEALEEGLNLLRRLLAVSHPVSLDSNPIHILDRMSEDREIVYSPLIFGYSNYSREGFRPALIHFANLPSQHREPSGSVIGGVGMAISARCGHKELAAQFAMLAASPECQQGLYFESGGQPGYRAAWTNASINERTNGFFANTLATLEQAYVRPRYAGYVSCQERAGIVLHDGLRKGLGSKEIAESLRGLLALGEEALHEFDK